MSEAGHLILQTWEFGFVHQVLAFLRVEEDSISGKVRDFNPHLLDKMCTVAEPTRAMAT